MGRPGPGGAGDAGTGSAQDWKAKHGGEGADSSWWSKMTNAIPSGYRVRQPFEESKEGDELYPVWCGAAAPIPVHLAPHGRPTRFRAQALEHRGPR